MTTIHRFMPAEGDDDQCERCAITVAAAAMPALDIRCPAGDCPAPSNPERGCVVVRARDKACCIYCGRTAGRFTGREPDDEYDGLG